VFDISSLFPSVLTLFSDIQGGALATWTSYDGNDNPTDDQVFFKQVTKAYGIQDIGQQYFRNGADGLTPVWDFTQVYGPNAIAYAELVGSVSSSLTPSPELDSPSGSVDWQYLDVTSGSLAQEILLVYTDGGEPPSQVRIPRSIKCSARLNLAFLVYARISRHYGQIHRTVL
jgi:hypothetical protein